MFEPLESFGGVSGGRPVEDDDTWAATVVEGDGFGSEVLRAHLALAIVAGPPDDGPVDPGRHDLEVFGEGVVSGDVPAGGAVGRCAGGRHADGTAGCPDVGCPDAVGPDESLVDAVVAARRGQARLVWDELVAIAGLLARWSVRSPLDEPGSSRERDSRLERTERSAGRGYVDPTAADLAPAFVITEVALACGVSEHATAQRFDAAVALITYGRLPKTAAALRAGTLDWEKVRLIVTGTQELAPAAASAVEALVLPRAPVLNLMALREEIAAAVLIVDAVAAAERAARARRDRKVWFRPSPDQMGQMCATMGAEDLALVRARLDAAATLARGTGDSRTADQVRVDTLVHALTGGPSARQPLDPTGVDTGRTGSGTAETGTGVAETVTGTRDAHEDAGYTAFPAGDSDLSLPADGAGEDPDASGSAMPAPAQAHVLVTMTLETLLGLRDDAAYLAGYGPVSATMARDLAGHGVWRCAAVDEHGTLLGLGRKSYTPAYTPGEPLADFVRTRDRFCTFPTCRARAERHCDLDHRTPHARAGATCACNVQALCRRHHRLKTTGMITATVSTDPDHPSGTLIWRTRAGKTHTRPPTPMTPVTAMTPSGSRVLIGVPQDDPPPF